MHHPTDRIAHTTAFVTPVMKHWLEREIAQSLGRVREDKMTVHAARIGHVYVTRSLCISIVSVFWQFVIFRWVDRLGSERNRLGSLLRK